MGEGERTSEERGLTLAPWEPRHASPDELAAWETLAREGQAAGERPIEWWRGCRAQIVAEEPGRFKLRFLTALVVGGLTREMASVLFSRTPRGEIVLPGRWALHVFASLVETIHDPEERAIAREFCQAAAEEPAKDIVLDADTETVLAWLPHADELPVVHEVIPPDFVIELRYRRRRARRTWQ